MVTRTVTVVVLLTCHTAQTVVAVMASVGAENYTTHNVSYTPANTRSRADAGSMLG